MKDMLLYVNQVYNLPLSVQDKRTPLVCIPLLLSLLPPLLQGRLRVLGRGNHGITNVLKLL